METVKLCLVRVGAHSCLAVFNNSLEIDVHSFKVYTFDFNLLLMQLLSILFSEEKGPKSSWQEAAIWKGFKQGNVLI